MGTTKVCPNSVQKTWQHVLPLVLGPARFDEKNVSMKTSVETRWYRNILSLDRNRLLSEAGSLDLLHHWVVALTVLLASSIGIFHLFARSDALTVTIGPVDTLETL